MNSLLKKSLPAALIASGLGLSSAAMADDELTGNMANSIHNFDNAGLDYVSQSLASSDPKCTTQLNLNKV